MGMIRLPTDPVPAVTAHAHPLQEHSRGHVLVIWAIGLVHEAEPLTVNFDRIIVVSI
jgi:hypothetical protein